MHSMLICVGLQQIPLLWLHFLIVLSTGDKLQCKPLYQRLQFDLLTWDPFKGSLEITNMSQVAYTKHSVGYPNHQDKWFPFLPGKHNTSKKFTGEAYPSCSFIQLLLCSSPDLPARYCCCCACPPQQCYEAIVTPKPLPVLHPIHLKFRLGSRGKRTNGSSQGESHPSPPQKIFKGRRNFNRMWQWLPLSPQSYSAHLLPT